MIYQSSYDYAIYISIFDIVILFVILVVAFFYAFAVSNNKSAKEPLYKYLPIALLLKIVAALAFALITIFFYPGDACEYFMYVNRLTKMLYTDSSHFFDILINGNLPEYWSYFNNETGYPAWYMWRVSNGVLVSRIFTPLMLLTYKSFILSTVIAALVGFSGLWKLYIVFCKMYPGMEKKFAIAILLFPSVLFWSSGILKDTLTISAVGWIVYCFYNIIILHRYKFKYFVIAILASILIINIKSYIFLALLPGLFIWLFFDKLMAMKTAFLRIIIAPVLIIIVFGVFSVLMSNVSGSMGNYGDVNKSLEQAKIIQEDLVRANQYGDNFYDIGKFEATPIGVLKKVPIATVSGIFRPFIWEARNPFVLLAALESLFMMLLLVYSLVKVGFVQFFRNIAKEPLLIFSMSFVLIFGFGVGLASANFGALVRYKIPLLPFFAASLFILMDKAKKRKVED